MAEITLPFLMTFNDAVTTAFNERLTTAPTFYGRFSMDVPSRGRENVYPRMDDIPGMREWIGDRVINALSGKVFAIPNKTFEGTLEVSRDDFEDDQYGFYTPVVQQLGQEAAELPDKLVAGVLAAGESTPCYDGTSFFGSAHTTYTSAGTMAAPVAYTNLQEPNSIPGVTGDVAGPAWYLFCTRQVLKPIIVQRRRPFVLTPRMNLSDPTVFERNAFLWGVDGRMNVGVGLYQMALKSYAPLMPDYYAAARAIMASQHRADGTPLGLIPDLLVHPPSLASQARTLLLSDYVNATSNPWKGSATPLETTWLS